MTRVMIKCPATGEPVSTGMSMDKASLESSTLSMNSVSCPHCQQMHTWNKEDAYLERQAD